MRGSTRSAIGRRVSPFLLKNHGGYTSVASATAKGGRKQARLAYGSLAPGLEHIDAIGRA
jgi:hypothetical protein